MGQQTSFFCLQNRHWRIIAIDTSYNGNGLPILGMIPLINKIPGVGGDCELPAALMKWLNEVVLKEPDNRGIIIMSHHQYYSGFEDKFPKPARQLWDAGIQSPVLWFWGHEHRLAGYDLGGSENLQAYGRCVGHGGMPLKPESPTKTPAPKFYDERQGVKQAGDEREGAVGYGVNGHVNLEFQGPSLTATYVDLDGTKILTETWRADGHSAVQYVSGKKLISDPDFHA
jgi:calcineurin-like phosphoesterase family protein